MHFSYRKYDLGSHSLNAYTTINQLVKLDSGHKKIELL